MSTPGYHWGGEHFCTPDGAELYQTEPQRLTDHGFPVEVNMAEHEPTFCAVCLFFFTDAHPTGAHQPPENGTNHEA